MDTIITLDPEAVKQIFAEAEDQGAYMVALYKLVLPNWDDIISINGWPSCNDRTWKAIARMAMDHDQKHTSAFAGGCWMNKGFSTSHGEHLTDWQVSLKGVTFTTKEDYSDAH